MKGNGSTPGTAALYELIEQIRADVRDDALRRRAMLLCWVDDAERDCGYGESGKPPRTAQIRAFWKECGEPELKG